ncbi:DUF4738 domain-containing protein [Prevotella sp. OH937_COT-195]|nr:DUF4738 domain-containing protein [Prevotella sp. OH937_COT-195]
MTLYKNIPFILLSLAFILVSCKYENKEKDFCKEDLKAKKMMQGVWYDELEDNVVFSVNGDTIFYPDSISLPVAFTVINDSLCLNGAIMTKYPIKNLTEHLLIFKNQNGDEIKLFKDENASSKKVDLVKYNRHVAINQHRIIKKDTVVMLEGVKNHIYIQVNPTTYKVSKSNYDNEGVRVDNIYYDNTVSICIVKNSVKTFIHDFHKKEFLGTIPSGIIQQSILNDIIYEGHDSDGFHFYATMGIPDTPSNYIAEIIVSYNNKHTISKIMN